MLFVRDAQRQADEQGRADAPAKGQAEVRKQPEEWRLRLVQSRDRPCIASCTIPGIPGHARSCFVTNSYLVAACSAAGSGLAGSEAADDTSQADEDTPTPSAKHIAELR